MQFYTFTMNPCTQYMNYTPLALQHQTYTLVPWLFCSVLIAQTGNKQTVALKVLHITTNRHTHGKRPCINDFTQSMSFLLGLETHFATFYNI